MTRDEAERLLDEHEEATADATMQHSSDFKSERKKQRYRESRAAVLDAMTRAQWRDTETDPPPKDQPVLLYCPDRGCQTNRARVELGPYWTSRGSLHAWATHWQPLPAAPEAP